MKDLPNNPYKFRQSLYSEDENVRDLIFKGYTVPYLIDKNKEAVVILKIFKYVDIQQNCQIYFDS